MKHFLWICLCALALAGVIRVGAYAKDSEDVVPVYRLYNQTNQEHLYTTNYTEYQNCVKVGWKDEGIGWYAPKTSNWPVRRLYHAPTGYHLYSQNPIEMNMLVSAGWKLEGVGFYSSERKEVEVRRQFHPVTHMHNYSYNKAEIQFLGEHGWKLEGTAWFARKTPPGAPIGKSGGSPEPPAPDPGTEPDPGTPEEESGITQEMKNALDDANDLMDVRPCSWAWIYDYLLNDLKYSAEAAKYGADNCCSDWNASALKNAKWYLEDSSKENGGYSETTLYEQLTVGEEFTADQADYAVANCGADWNQEAAYEAWDVFAQLEQPSSRAMVKDWLIDEGFTEAQAEYGVEHSGIDWTEQAEYYIEYHWDEIYYYLSRKDLVQYLVNDGFTESEAEAAIDAAGIDFADSALKACYEYIAGPSVMTQEEVVQLLTESLGFTAEEAAAAAQAYFASFES